ncbi:MAG: hypothetical protein A2293_11920 [Elusimicrobia bacterium RIFOXYB2_FULL_49_7]|nr:MAG: hypothetical protein A2293_11920 [Elusimicrobia bacterium RIFOXYB2_FULL_49_7]
MEGLRNVFDNKEEFEKLRGLILEALQKFSDYRGGNLTYGEIMFVLECVLDEMRNTSEKQAGKNVKGFGRDVTFTSLFEMTGRMVETLLKKGMISSQEEAFIVHGEE